MIPWLEFIHLKTLTYQKHYTFKHFLIIPFRYVVSPIQCWMPMEFKGGWEQYAEVVL